MFIIGSLKSFFLYVYVDKKEYFSVGWFGEVLVNDAHKFSVVFWHSSCE